MNRFRVEPVKAGGDALRHHRNGIASSRFRASRRVTRPCVCAQCDTMARPRRASSAAGGQSVIEPPGPMWFYASRYGNGGPAMKTLIKQTAGRVLSNFPRAQDKVKKWNELLFWKMHLRKTEGRFHNG